MAKWLTVFPIIANIFRGGTTKPTENPAATLHKNTRASWTFYLGCADFYLDILWLDYIDPQALRPVTYNNIP